MIYTVTLNPAIDCIMQVESFCPGKTNRAGTSVCLPGGKGINVSVVLRNLGTDSVLLGFLAGFTGEEIRRMLLHQGCCCDFITVPSGFSRINVKLKGAEETEINGAGPFISQADTEKLMAQTRALKSGDILVLAGSIPAGISQSIYEDMMQQLSGKAVSVVVDAEGALLRRSLKYRPFFIKPNHHELGALFRTEIRCPEEAVHYGRLLQKMGARNVLVSMAEQGAVLCTETGRVLHQSAAKGTVINSVGAGDSMVAGFLAGWQKTGDYEAALRMGTAAGAASAFSMQLASEADVQCILRTLPQATEF
ncbi:MAG: 1-phosphofructokinase [Ruminococcus sp.]|nr:1-phosphofructokinase [Ruminococcus sp.]